jgi:hypothetical protein
MRILYKILWVVACIGVLAVSSYLFYPRPVPRPILPGGHDPDRAAQNAVDTLDKVNSDASAQRKLLQDYQDRKSSHAATPGTPAAKPEAGKTGSP